MYYALIADTLTGWPRTDAVRRSDGVQVPADPRNVDWLAYLAWLAAGNSPDPVPRTPDATPAVTGNQWAFALGDLGLAAAWRAATAKSKDKDQIRIGLIARDTPLVVTDPLLIRVAANAGTDSSGAAIIDVPTVFAKALTETT